MLVNQDYDETVCLKQKANDNCLQAYTKPIRSAIRFASVYPTYVIITSSSAIWYINEKIFLVVSRFFNVDVGRNWLIKNHST